MPPPTRGKIELGSRFREQRMPHGAAGDREAGKEDPMFTRIWQTKSSIGAAVLAAALLLPLIAKAEDAKKYPDWDALWIRGSPVGAWDPANPPGRGQKPPLTPEFQAVWQANLAKQARGEEFDIKSTCGPVGMPRLMTLYEPIEIVVKPKMTYMLAESMSPIRRIYTDGREWPKTDDEGFLGYSIGKWSDSTNSGTYDTLEVETRSMRG